jgi:hypothetical protein
MYGIGGGEYDGAAGRKSKAYEVVSGDLDGCLTVGCDSDDPALASQRGRNIQVAVHIEREPLRPS